MDEYTDLDKLERQVAALLAMARQIVRGAEEHSRTPTAEEDARVLELMSRVRGLEARIAHVRRSHERHERGDAS